MTTRPWMPWYIADFVGDTQHLDAAETGAYMLLLGHYWLNGGKLPEGEAAMARIARMTPPQWKRSREALLKFFPGGQNKRADEEMKKTAEVSASYSARASQAANARWAKHASGNAPSMPQAMHDECLGMPISQSHSSEPKGSGEAPSDPKADLFRRGREVFGKSAGGGLTSKILRSLGNEDDPKVIARARARIEEASAKAKPAEWIGRVLAGPRQAVTAQGDLIPDGVI